MAVSGNICFEEASNLNPSKYNGRNRHLTFSRLPIEVLELVLSYFDNESLLRISEVCQTWCQLFHTQHFWRCVMLNRGLMKQWDKISSHIKNHPDFWQVYYAMIKYRFLNNLVRNPSGSEGFTGWTFMSGELGGWTVENETDYVNILPTPLPLDPEDNSKFCFATNQFSCSKEQIIDLWKFGLTHPVLRACVPFVISWSEWVTTPLGHPGIYEAKVQFLDTDLGHISPYSPYEYKVRANLAGGTPWKLFSRNFVINWKNAHEVIDDLRYFYIYHGGMESGEGQGHWGPKIARTSLKISFIDG